MSTVHVIIGAGSAPKTVIHEGLNDILDDGDTIALPWYGIKPVPDGLVEVYSYILDNEVDFVMVHASGSTPPKAFREAAEGGQGDIEEVGNVNTALMKLVDGNGKILFMWDSDDEDGTVALATRIFETVSEKVKVVELTNGLAPVALVPDEPEETAPADKEEEDPTDDGPVPYTREELSHMPVASLKKMAKNNGLPNGVTGKENYIKVILGEELPDFAYPPKADGSPNKGEDEEAPAKPVTIADKDLTQPPPAGWNPAVGNDAKEQLRKSLLNVTPVEEQIVLIEEFRAIAIGVGDYIIDCIPVGRNRSLALTALEDVVMRGVKGILLD